MRTVTHWGRFDQVRIVILCDRFDLLLCFRFLELNILWFIQYNHVQSTSVDGAERMVSMVPDASELVHLHCASFGFCVINLEYLELVDHWL